MQRATIFPISTALLAVQKKRTACASPPCVQAKSISSTAWLMPTPRRLLKITAVSSRPGRSPRWGRRTSASISTKARFPTKLPKARCCARRWPMPLTTMPFAPPCFTTVGNPPPATIHLIRPGIQPVSGPIRHLIQTKPSFWCARPKQLARRSICNLSIPIPICSKPESCCSRCGATSA